MDLKEKNFDHHAFDSTGMFAFDFRFWLKLARFSKFSRPQMNERFFFSVAEIFEAQNQGGKLTKKSNQNNICCHRCANVPMSLFPFRFQVPNCRTGPFHVPFPWVTVPMGSMSSGDCIAHAKYPKMHSHWYFGQANEAIKSRQPAISQRTKNISRLKIVIFPAKMYYSSAHLPEYCWWDLQLHWSYRCGNAV